MIKIRDIIHHLEQIAPLVYQEEYDNSGLVIGDPSVPVTGVLICLDVTVTVLQEAKAKDCNLVIAHHPIIFRPIYSPGIRKGSKNQSPFYLSFHPYTA